MYTKRIDNLRSVLRNLRERMHLLRFSICALNEVLTDYYTPDLAKGIQDLERLNIRYERLYSELTDKFTCLNILNY